MKASYIEASAPPDYQDVISRLARGTSLAPLKTRFIQSSGRIYIRIPDGISDEKFVCAAKERGLSDAKPSLSLDVL